MGVWGGCATEAGRIKPVNQDGILFCSRRRKKDWTALGVVSDGISGLARGELAAALIRDLAYQWFCSVEEQPEEELSLSFERTLQEANHRICCDLWEEKGIRTGATVSACLLVGRNLHCYQAGDSRIYRGRRGRWQLLTKDQSVWQERGGRLKLCLANYVGKAEPLVLETARVRLETGDVVLYCSDGFYKTMGEDDLQWFFERDSFAGPDEGCRELIRRAESRGERDNISVGFMRLCAESGIRGFLSGLADRRAEERMSMGWENTDETEF